MRRPPEGPRVPVSADMPEDRRSWTDPPAALQGNPALSADRKGAVGVGGQGRRTIGPGEPVAPRIRDAAWRDGDGNGSGPLVSLIVSFRSTLPDCRSRARTDWE